MSVPMAAMTHFLGIAVFFAATSMPKVATKARADRPSPQ
jgi:hypothetical protein